MKSAILEVAAELVSFLCRSGKIRISGSGGWRPSCGSPVANRPRFSVLSAFRMRRRLLWSVLPLVLVSLPVLGAVTGSVSGTVRDQSGGVLPHTAVEVQNTQTGISQTVQTNASGLYTFPTLSPGHYNISIRRSGFKMFRETGLVIQVNSSLRVDAVLQVGTSTQSITVEAAAAQVNTTNAQMGQLIPGKTIVNMPLNGRSYTDLLALQPGVVAQSSGIEYVAIVAPDAGSVNPGQLSMSGGRENFNGYMINGANVEEGTFDTPMVVPNLDSIAEFRILTNNTNAEFGNYSGGQVNVVTKSGTNQFHGDLFEFLRNTDLDARNYFSPTRGVYRQNQFGGTIGGPILHNKLFFFGDYQGTRQNIGESTGDISVPSAADRTGDLSDMAASMTGSVDGQFWANTLSGRLGYRVNAGEPYYTPGCTSSASCVFPNAIIPQRAWDAPASHLLSYIPTANTPGGFFSTSAFPAPLQDDKGSIRLDGTTRWGSLSAYYFDDQYNATNPYAGGSLPGFSGSTNGSSQLLVLGDTKTFGSATVNQFTFSFVRFLNHIGMPVGGVGPSMTSLGFASPADGGIFPTSGPQWQGVPSINLNEYSFGVTGFPNRQINNTFQWQDNFSRLIGKHSLTFGVDYHYDQIKSNFFFSWSDGAFFFSGTETGSDFADLLLGAPSVYNQSSPALMYMKDWYLGSFAQDTWRVAPSLTLDYGLRWEILPYWYDSENENPTYMLGEQSKKFPGAPRGYVFPGDPGIPSTTTPTSLGDFAPRLGLAYAPNPSGGFLRKLFGSGRQTSIRAGYGIYYTSIEGQTIQNGGGAYAPYGMFWVSEGSPLLSRPFITRATGQSQGERFPLATPPKNVSSSNPDTNVNWAQFLPISSASAVDPHDKLPYTQAYDLSIQRQLGANTLLDLSYVGTQGVRLIVDLDNNPGVPSSCLAVSQPSEVLPGTPTCGPFGENGVYYPVSGGVVNGTRAPFGPLFGGNAYYKSMGHSTYNALEISLHHTGRRSQFLAGYTYSKAMDDSSGYGDQVYPYDPSLSRELSAFDMMHNFVVSYTYELPFDKAFKAQNRWTQGWDLSGITRFATGLPVTLSEGDDNSLIGSCNTGPNNNCLDEPDFTPGKVLHDTNPRKGQTYFNTALFSPEKLGQFGTARRRFFNGPGINNWDMALLKTFALTEGKSIEFRAEFFNLFNHTQFTGVNGNVNSSTFGLVQNAANPRIGQVALKFLF